MVYRAKLFDKHCMWYVGWLINRRELINDVKQFYS